ncbi:hypothetical protein [Flavobacterium lacustre]|uniref:hypothetical protein n=1 Tax=Flavobacterium lacustre TaxID=3016339 RepID=UPI0022B63D95|nr:hypothetical protein [Flavobacterium lacustre]
MKKFSIYEPNPLYPSRTLILYSIIIVLFASAIITQKIYGTHENIIFQTLIYLAGGVFIFGLLISFFGMGKTKPLYGKIIGYINFTKEEITIGQKVIEITKIKKIEFEGVDWLGLYEGYQTFSFENKLSNGTKNWIIINTESSVIKVRFQKNEGCELSELKEEFMEYYKLGKISYLQLIDNLCINSTEEQKELKSRKL